jgi:hypothetical protein
MQFVSCLAAMAVMSLAGSFIAVFVLQSDNPVQAQAGAAGVVRGTQFVLVDKKGAERARLDIGDEGGVRFTMLDNKGKARVQLNSGGDTAFFQLLDRNGVPRYLVGQGDDVVLQTFTDTKGENRAMQQFKDNGQTLFAFNGPGKKNLMTLMASPKDASTLILTDPTGKNQLTMFAKDDQTSMKLSAGDGSLLASTLGDGRPLIALSKADHLRMRQLLGKEGDPEFIFLNDKRQAVWRAGAKKKKEEDKDK